MNRDTEGAQLFRWLSCYAVILPGKKNDLPINATNDACFLMYLGKVVYVAYMQ